MCRVGEDEGRGAVQKVGGFHLPACCYPVKAQSQPAVRDFTPKRTSAPRSGAWVRVPTHACGCLLWGPAARLPSGFSTDSWSCWQGQDVTSPAGEKNPQPQASLTKPRRVQERGGSPCYGNLQTADSPDTEPGLDFFFLIFFFSSPSFLPKSRKCSSGGIWAGSWTCRGMR